MKYPACLFLLLSALWLSSGCASHGPAYLGNTGMYLTKPNYNGQRAGGFAFSGRINQGYVYYAEEQNRSFEFSGHVTLLWKNFYLAGGLFGYGGKYQIDRDSSAGVSLKPYGYEGFGQRFEIGARIPLEPKLDLLFGISEEMFGQRGAYEDETEGDIEDIFGDTFTLGIDGFGIGYNLDLRFTPTPTSNIGLRYTWDTVVGNADNPPLGYLNLDYTHRLTLHGTLKRLTAFAQVGFANTGQDMYSVGLSYAFPFWQNRALAN
ncbi:MAG: hypothetical protein IT260_14260 [Saprospiraceae bacterium]|nr:hypothetical protein [Saprospiraceae bacterium]